MRTNLIVVGRDMGIAKLLVIPALLLLSIWIGFQIDPDRDWIAWLFIVVLPISIVVVVTILRFRAGKKGGKNEH